MSRDFYELLHLQKGEMTMNELLEDLKIYEETGTSPMIEQSKLIEVNDGQKKDKR